MSDLWKPYLSLSADSFVFVLGKKSLEIFIFDTHIHNLWVKSRNWVNIPNSKHLDNLSFFFLWLTPLRDPKYLLSKRLLWSLLEKYLFRRKYLFLTLDPNFHTLLSKCHKSSILSLFALLWALSDDYCFKKTLKIFAIVRKKRLEFEL